MELNAWMKEIPDYKSIKEINIAGAHDASTRFCEFGLFSSCQSLSVRDMLNIGVRALDLRVDGENMVHSFTKCKKARFGAALKIYDIIKDITEFLKANPSETVIVFFKNDGKTNGKTCLDLLVDNIINKNFDEWYLENRFPCLAEVRGKIVLINRVDSSIGIDFSKMPYQGGMKETFAEDFLPNTYDTVTVQDRYVLTRKKKWCCAVKPILENESRYKGKFVLNHLSTAGLPLVPRFNAVYINRKFLKFSLKSGGNYGFLMCDFLSSAITQKIIKTNFLNS